MSNQVLNRPSCTNVRAVLKFEIGPGKFRMWERGVSKMGNSHSKPLRHESLKGKSKVGSDVSKSSCGYCAGICFFRANHDEWYTYLWSHFPSLGTSYVKQFGGNYPASFDLRDTIHVFPGPTDYIKCAVDPPISHHTKILVMDKVHFADGIGRIVNQQHGLIHPTARG